MCCIFVWANHMEMGNNLTSNDIKLVYNKKLELLRPRELRLYGNMLLYYKERDKIERITELFWF